MRPRAIRTTTSRWLGLLAAALLLLTGLAALTTLAPRPAAAEEPPRARFAPAPDWVAPIGVPDTAGVGSEMLHDGVADLLSDSQTRVGFGPETTFNRYVSQVVEPSGVSTVGRIQVDFAATYQTLTLHWIRLVRDGVVQERLDPAQVRILQQEEDLDLDLYYQGATALVLLDDVRVGDRVDYAYSITGANPIFEGRYQDWHYLEWWYPFGRIHTRIIAPADRPLYFKPRNTETEPMVWRHGDVVEYVLSGDNVAARVGEDAMPSDYDPLASVQVSEYETWADVARWADATFETGAPDGDEVKQLAERIRAAHDGDAERIIAALRFVQDEVRYLGLEIGVNAFEPHPPAQTLERRYGDCKDKSTLLVAVLAELGIEANVALVHTELGAEVAELQPTASAFDHAIVRVRHDGLAYWLDPTISYERGPLEEQEWPDFGFALVVGARAEGLTQVRPSRAKTPPGHLRHHYRATDYRAPGELEITSTFRGRRANEYRAWAASRPRDAIERQYQNYYARDRQKIELAAPIEIDDDPEHNTIVVREQYRVPDLWQWEEDEGRFVATFTARELRDSLPAPDTVQRTHPLAFPHPAATLFEILIETPEPMEIDEVGERIVGPAFEVDYEAEELERGALLTWFYHSTADRIEARDVAAHLDAIDDVWGVSEYWLGSSQEAGSAGGGLGGEAGARAAGPGTALARFFGDWNRSPWPASVCAFAALLALFVLGPRLALRRGLVALREVHLAKSVAWLQRARWLAFSWTTLHRRVTLALSVALGLMGRIDEARGHAAALVRRPMGPLANDLVTTVAWAWRAMLLRDGEPERAGFCADRAVAMLAHLQGESAREARVAVCAHAARALVRARSGDCAGARDDIEAAHAHAERISGPGDRRGWLSLLPLVAHVGRAHLALAEASGDLARAAAESRVVLERREQDWPDGHPFVLELRLAHAELLGRAGDTVGAWHALDRVRAALPNTVDAESPLHVRARRLADRLDAR